MKRSEAFSRRVGPKVMCGLLVLSALLVSTTIIAASSAEPLEGPSVADRAKGDPHCEAGADVATARLVQARYDGIRDLRAEFDQESQSASFAGAPLMDSAPKSGTVVFAKPGKMRWVYREPDASVVVSDGATLWIHDVEGATVTRLEVTRGYLSGAALQFLLGDVKILDEFEVRATDCNAERVTLDLTPKTDATYERLGLVASRATGDIEATSVVDLFGNRTEIRFRGVEINQDPEPSVFEFIVPDGVEVIDYAG